MYVGISKTMVAMHGLSDKQGLFAVIDEVLGYGLE